MLQGKYQVPQSDNKDSLLARHERGVFQELQSFLGDAGSKDTTHRSDTFAQNVTPRSRDLVEAIGQRFAYDSAVEFGTVRPELIDIYEADCMLQDQAWYVEHAGMTSREIRSRHTSAIERARPHLQAIIEEFDMAKHFDSTPLVSAKHWEDLMSQLPHFGHQKDSTKQAPAKEVVVSYSDKVVIQSPSRLLWIFQAARSVLF